MTTDSPRMSSTTLFQANSIFGLSKARCCMILEALNSSRRWMIVTLLANLVRKVASSIAESPPPTTAISWPLKKKPSQVAHVDRPCPMSRCSASRPSITDWAPVETISELARWVGVDELGSPIQTLKGLSDRSTRLTRWLTISAPNRDAWARMSAINCGPVTPSGKPGKFSTSVVSINWPPGWSLVDEGSPSITNGSRSALAA